MSSGEVSGPSDAGRERIAGHEEAAHERRNWVRLTFGCNNRCAFCLDSSGHTGEVRDREEVKRQILDGRSKGATRLILSGGEPTIHPSFVDFVRLGARAGYSKIQVITNGRLFSYGPFLDRCLDAGLSEITFSLHGPDAGTHDALVGVKGAFDQETAGLRRALADGRPVVNVDVVVSRANVARLAGMLELCLSWGVREFDLLQVVPFGRAWTESREALFYDLAGMRTHLLAAFAFARRPGVHVWLNRFPPQHLEGYEDMIQDPYKLNDEVRGRREEFARLLDDGVPLDCREPDTRCGHCYLVSFCNELEAVRDTAARGAFQIVRVETESEARQLPAFGGDPSSERRALPAGVTVAPDPLPIPEQARGAGAKRLWVVAPDLTRALAAMVPFADVPGLDLELELENDEGLEEEVQGGLLDGRRLVRAVVAARDAAAQAMRLLAMEGEFEVVVPLERSTGEWLLGMAEAPARLVLRMPVRERLTESAENDLDLGGFFARFRLDVPVEDIPACVTGRLPRVRPSVLDSAMMTPGGRIEIFRYARRYILDSFRTKSLRCRECLHDATCAGLPVNYVRARGYAVLNPVRR